MAQIEIHLTGENPYLVVDEISDEWPADAARVA
jgi:hypothetical protein